MLELNGGAEGSGGFERDESNPLEADVIIVDEMSMVDISLMYSLLKAISVGTRLFLSGMSISFRVSDREVYSVILSNHMPAM